MRSNRPLLRFCCAALALSAWSIVRLHAQTTHLVGPGGFAQIDPAIQAARAGDTVLITAAGRYEHFTLDRGLTVRAAAGVRPLIANAQTVFSTRGTTIRIPAGETGELVGLAFAPQLPFLGTLWIGQVRVTSGTAVFRDCWLEGQTSGCGVGWPALEVEDAAVALQLCRLRGHDRDGVALRARRSTISAFDSTFEGGDGCWDSYAFAADAIQLEASALHGSRLLIEGGSTPLMNPDYDAGHGVLVDARSRLWLAHAIVRGGNGGTSRGRGGDGVRNLSSAPVEVLRLTASGGLGAPPGAPIYGPSFSNPSLVVAWAHPVGPPLGATWTLHYQLPPGTPVVALVGWRPDPGTATALAQPLWLAADPAPIALGVTTAGTLGDAALALAIPNLSALRGVRLWSQGAVPAGLPIQLTPLCGGQVW